MSGVIFIDICLIIIVCINSVFKMVDVINDVFFKINRFDG